MVINCVYLVKTNELFILIWLKINLMIVNCELLEQSVHSSAVMLKQWLSTSKAISFKHLFWITGEMSLFVFLFDHAWSPFLILIHTRLFSGFLAVTSFFW